jgi:excisionase family DNA binding protein
MVDRIIDEGTLSNEEGAQILGCSPGTLRVWVSQRRVPFVKIGRLTRFLRQDLEEFIQSRRVPVEKQELRR